MPDSSDRTPVMQQHDHEGGRPSCEVTSFCAKFEAQCGALVNHVKTRTSEAKSTGWPICSLADLVRGIDWTLYRLKSTLVSIFVFTLEAKLFKQKGPAHDERALSI